MKNALSLDKLTLKELSAIASAAKIPRWSRMKKTELLARLVALGAAAPSLERALRIRDAKRLGVSCDAASPFPSDVRSTTARSSATSVEKTSTVSQAPPAKKSSESKNRAASSGSKSAAPRTVERSKPEPNRSTEKRVRRDVSTSNVAPSPVSTAAASTSTTPPSRAKSKNAKSTLQVEKKPSVRASEPSKNAKSKNASSDAARSDAKSTAPSAAAPRSSNPEAVAPTPPSRVSTLREKMRLRKTLGRETDATDRLVLAVCDSYWLRACWEVTPRLVERVRSAMGRHWHTADPTLRLFKIDKEPQGATRREFVADVPVRGGVDVWYLDVDDPPSSFMVELGYLARDKQFFTLISSNVVETPQQSVREAFADLGASSDFNGFAQRAFPGPPPGFGATRSNPFATNDATSSETKFAGALERSNGALLFPDDFQFNVDAEIVVRGTASPGVRIRVKEEPVRVKDDGTFSIRYRLPERRHVFPVVATSADGVETQTIILAIDRNTKILEPVFKEEEEE